MKAPWWFRILRAPFVLLFSLFIIPGGMLFNDWRYIEDYFKENL